MQAFTQINLKNSADTDGILHVPLQPFVLFNYEAGSANE